MTAGCSSEGTPSERVTDSSATAQTSGATSSNGQGEVPAPLPSVAASDGVQPGSPGIEPSVAPSSAGDSAPLASSGPMTLEPVAPEPAVSEPAVPGPVTSEPVVPDPGTPPVAPDSGTPPVAPDPGTPSVAPDPGTPSVAPDSGFESSSAELIASFELGWNLGNSLDVPEGETAWNNPVVSRELLEAVAAAGFDVVRVPVTWSLFLGPGPEYSVDAARLTRVEEVLGYVLDSGMHAIVNLHHDGADGLEGVEWLSLNDPSGEVSDSHNAAVEAQFVAVWTQLAQHFGAYDSRLLFESMNEIHDGYDAPDPVYGERMGQFLDAFAIQVQYDFHHHRATIQATISAGLEDETSERFNGLPGLALAQAVVHLATAPKSNRAYVAIKAAMEAAEGTADAPVPLHLRNASTWLMKEWGFAEGYRYAHDFDEGYVEMSCLPDDLGDARFYEPGELGYEARIAEWMKRRGQLEE